MSCKNVLFFNIPQYARGIAGHNSVSRHILGHHAARSHQGIFADSDLGQNCGARTNRCARFHQSLLNLPVLLGLQLAIRSGGAGIGIVDKGNIMADEHFVFYHHTFTDKRVARNLAVLADLGIFLNLDESSYFGAVANLAAIQVDKFRKAHIFSELYIRGNANELIHSWMILPFCLRDSSAASSMRTMRKPAWPSLKGVLLLRMQSTKYAASTFSASTCSTLGAHMSPVR